MTPEQAKQVADALVAAGPDGWPQLTNDPEVNYETDRATEQRFAAEDNEPSYMVPWG